MKGTAGEKTKLFILLAGILMLLGKTSKMRVYAMQEQTEEEETVLEDYYDNFYDSAGMANLEKELNAIRESYGNTGDISFLDIYELLLTGEVDMAVSAALEGFYQNITGEVMQNRELLVRLVILVIIAAVFNNYSSIMKISYVGEQGFYITYLLIAVLLLQSFTIAYDLAEETVMYLKEIMECIMPAFYMSIVLCSGLTTSHMVNSMFLWMLAVIEKVLLVVILPAVRIYFLIVLLNQINTKDRFSKLAGLIKQAIQFTLKAIVTGIIGLNVMKSMLIPVYENAKYNVLQKGLSMVPGGASFSGLTTILLGAGVLIKNSVGITVVVILLVLGGVPLLKLLCFYLAYRLILALVQPISDNRILSGIQGAADSTEILVRATATSIVLSVLSIAIVILTTNVRMYSG
ncbi:MAG: stage III sporulation protein AE [Lachnospiraceae bacterium]|nr:stage III sporulation protein AE [Lachnospiraceae bacterium]MDE6627294.1 stage III sporulation protein AE [Lachnospiraceae bacterium]